MFGALVGVRLGLLDCIRIAGSLNVGLGMSGECYMIRRALGLERHLLGAPVAGEAPNSRGTKARVL